MILDYTDPFSLTHVFFPAEGRRCILLTAFTIPPTAHHQTRRSRVCARFSQRMILEAHFPTASVRQTDWRVAYWFCVWPNCAQEPKAPPVQRLFTSTALKSKRLTLPTAALRSPTAHFLTLTVFFVMVCFPESIEDTGEKGKRSTKQYSPSRRKRTELQLRK